MKIQSILIAACLSTLFSCKEEVTLITSENSSNRIAFGTEKLAESLEEAGYEVKRTKGAEDPGKGISVVIGEWEDRKVNEISAKAGISFDSVPGKEGFSIKSAGNVFIVKGSDASGALYACLEIADRVKAGRRLPASLDMTDAPEMVMRGSCIGMQKPVYLPGRKVYEYPYTPETFPWFYDKEHWIRYLDMLAANRMNSLYLWNGHPFSSLVKLEEYPDAVEVDGETFKKNEEIFRFITEEADKRGIWVIQMFYNIIVSKPFAEKHGLETQDRSRPIIPVVSDYTRKSVAAFIEKYPNVGLLVALGEAINTIEDDVE
ncbi:MAG TPA: hypothetical protein VD772_12375, partial [Anseongella sp.]|nr:hypothetical protein [Anseongella sp.]